MVSIKVDIVAQSGVQSTLAVFRLASVFFAVLRSSEHSIDSLTPFLPARLGSSKYSTRKG